MFGVVASLACLATLSAASPLVSTSPSKAIYTSLESLSNARKSFVTDPTIARLVDERIATLTPFELLAMQGSSLAKAAAPVAALPQKAHEQQIKWQPSMDFDTDGCYNVPAVNAQGATTAGLAHNFVGLSSDCRDLSDLDNNNVYVRSRCNNGYCVHIYDYYFEKDVAVANFIDVGHTHDWEHIGVVVKGNDTLVRVSASQHSGREIKSAGDSSLRMDGNHPKVIYHKDGASTHCFRFANADDDKIENHKGVWFRGSVIDWEYGFPSTSVRDAYSTKDWGSATISIKPDTFSSRVSAIAGDCCSGFDSNYDEYLL